MKRISKMSRSFIDTILGKTKTRHQMEIAVMAVLFKSVDYRDLSVKEKAMLREMLDFILSRDIKIIELTYDECKKNYLNS